MHVTAHGADAAASRPYSAWFQVINATPPSSIELDLGWRWRMDQITDEERRRIAELVAEGVPPWKLPQQSNRSRHAIRRAVVALYRPAKPEPQRSPLRLSLAEREEISGGLAAGQLVRAIARGGGGQSVDAMPGGGGERRAAAVPGVRCRPAG